MTRNTRRCGTWNYVFRNHNLFYYQMKATLDKILLLEKKANMNWDT